MFKEKLDKLFELTLEESFHLYSNPHTSYTIGSDFEFEALQNQDRLIARYTKYLRSLRQNVTNENEDFDENEWSVGTDQHLMEIRTKVLHETEISIFKKLIEYLNQDERQGLIKYGPNCSAHVHVGVPQEFDMRNVYSVLNKLDTGQFKVLFPDRNFEGFASLDKKIDRTRTKYNGINVEKLSKGVIEFRYLSSLIFRDYDKFFDFIGHFVRLCKSSFNDNDVEVPNSEARNCRWPKGSKEELAISSDAESAYFYAKNVLKKPWPEGSVAEQTISRDAHYAYFYSYNVLKKKWPKKSTAEIVISNDAKYAYHYAKWVLEEPWPEWSTAEIVISYEAEYAYHYALYVLRKPWPKGSLAETTILNSFFSYSYNIFCKQYERQRQIDFEAK